MTYEEFYSRHCCY